MTVVAPGEIHNWLHALGETPGGFLADLHREHGVEFRLRRGTAGMAQALPTDDQQASAFGSADDPIRNPDDPSVSSAKAARDPARCSFLKMILT